MTKRHSKKTSKNEDESAIGVHSSTDTSLVPPTVYRSQSEKVADNSKSTTTKEPIATNAKTPLTEEDKKLFAEKVFKCFTPYRYFCYFLLRFPIQAAVTPTGFIFTYKKLSIPAIGYFITTSLLSIAALFFFLNTVGSVMDFPQIQPNEPNASIVLATRKGDLRFEEKFILRRNVIPLIVLISAFCHATVGSWQLYRQRHFAAEYFTFWTEIVKVICIDVADGVKRFITILVITYAIFLVVFFAVCAVGFVPVASGGPGLLGMLCVRCFYPAIHTHSKFWIVRGCGGFLFFYVMISSKTFMILFALICRLLRNAFVVWNNRLEQSLFVLDSSNLLSDLGKEKVKPEDKVENRTEFSLLFKDHVCLLDAMQGANTLFANIIESYYASQVCSIVLEVYYFYRSQSSEEFVEARRLDGVVITLYLIHSLGILITVSLAAAEVGEVAMEGLEVLRRRGMMGSMSDDELYFIMSMYTSYTGHFETALNGGGYFTLDKGFLVAIVGTVFSYFIILLQFSPALTIKKDDDSKVNYYNTVRLIKQVESSIQLVSKLKVGYLQLKEFSNSSDTTPNYSAPDMYNDWEYL